jgi:uncharacterized protein YkwD
MMLDPKLECIVFEVDRAETKMVQAPSGMRNFMKLAQIHFQPLGERRREALALQEFRMLRRWLAVALVLSVAGPWRAPDRLWGASSNSTLSFPADAEAQLLTMVNRDRAQEGLPALRLDNGLARAAQKHSSEMAVRRQLSHQFPGEPELQQRIATESKLQFDETGENVGYAESIERTEEGFMHSPPHRKNLLTPEYNAVGFGIVRSGNMLYVTQDFGHALPSYSSDHARDAAQESVHQMRTAAHLPALERFDGSAAQAAACEMAKMDSLRTPAPKGFYVLRYTTMQPEKLPSGAEKVVNGAVRSFALGICYSRTTSYPNGVYWVMLLLK